MCPLVYCDREVSAELILTDPVSLQHQSLDCAEDWSYEVQILSRVLKPVKSKPDFRPSPVRNPADLSTTDSGSGADDSDSEHLTKPQNHRNRRRSQRNVKEQRKSQQEQAVDEVRIFSFQRT